MPIIVDTHEYGDPQIKEASERIKRLIQEAAMRRGRRFHREAAIALRPSWLGSINWPFPTWSVRKRPFGWQVDDVGEHPDPIDVTTERVAAETRRP